ncbi:MAG TPA: CDP-alcohol phosphatidyltransferase family protein [Polyangia bacterium]|nr:CDP-alcohol phosphatidyltransferase family protein [Polyangia bacterium]
MRITANQVTFLRLALTPIPCWLLYQGVHGQFAALVFATLLGCTDFVDGYLARKHGPTVLGGLMDPIADKVFIAITFLPAVDLGWCPPWLVAALFAREFVVTAARSLYEKRGTPLKSSYLARYKTWVQMCGVAILMLLYTVSSSTMDILLAIAAVLPLVLFAIRYLVVKKMWKGAAAFAVTFSGLLVLHELTDSMITGTVLMYFIVGITYASGLGYLLSVGKLRGRGAVTAGELVRLVSAVALPILIVVMQRQNLGPKWALIALASLELAHGGLDNLLAHHHAEAGVAAWGARLVGEIALLGYALWADTPFIARLACLGAFAIGAVGLTLAFVQKRRYYLDPPAAKAKPLSVPMVA